MKFGGKFPSCKCCYLIRFNHCEHPQRDLTAGSPGPAADLWPSVTSEGLPRWLLMSSQGEQGP